MLWTEKYRPKSPLSPPSFHILLHGRPSTGKTTYAHRLSSNSIELNASNNRGINAIRKLKDYQNVTIILDECDNLTSDAQTCLRRILEFSTCRFILIANYLSKIILPLRSRLFPIKFKAEFLPFLQSVMEKEDVHLDLDYLWYQSKQDIRKCLNIMQAIKAINSDERFCEISMSDEDIPSSNVHLIDYFLGIIPLSLLDTFLDLDFKNVDLFVENFFEKNFLVSQFISTLIDCNRTVNYHFFSILSSADEMCVRGIDSELVLYFLCTEYISLKISNNGINLCI